MPDRLSLNFSHGNIKRIILNFRLIILPFSTDVGDDIENTVYRYSYLYSKLLPNIYPTKFIDQPY